MNRKYVKICDQIYDLILLLIKNQWLNTIEHYDKYMTYFN